MCNKSAKTTYTIKQQLNRYISLQDSDEQMIISSELSSDNLLSDAESEGNSLALLLLQRSFSAKRGYIFSRGQVFKGD